MSLSAADVQEGGDGPVQDALGRAAVGSVRRPRHDGLVVREGDSRVGQPGAQQRPSRTLQGPLRQLPDGRQEGQVDAGGRERAQRKVS